MRIKWVRKKKKKQLKNANESPVIKTRISEWGKAKALFLPQLRFFLYCHVDAINMCQNTLKHHISNPQMS